MAERTPMPELRLTNRGTLRRSELLGPWRAWHDEERKRIEAIEDRVQRGQEAYLLNLRWSALVDLVEPGCDPCESRGLFQILPPRMFRVTT